METIKTVRKNRVVKWDPVTGKVLLKDGSVYRDYGSASSAEEAITVYKKESRRLALIELFIMVLVFCTDNYRNAIIVSFCS